LPFSTSLQKTFSPEISSPVDFRGSEPKYECSRRGNNDREMVVDVSQDWVLACGVQQGLMQTPCTVSDSSDYSARCGQICRHALGERQSAGEHRLVGHPETSFVLIMKDGTIYKNTIK
jgi:hypothetical protein